MVARTGLAAVASLIGDPARAKMLDALVDGLAHPAGELARRARVSPSTASKHLARLLAAELIAVEPRGRERLFSLASPTVASALEALAQLATPEQPTSLRSSTRIEALRRARACYDHLAGFIAVAIADNLIERGALVLLEDAFQLTPAGEGLLRRLDVDIDRARAARRPLARACVDWTERRPHIAGALGAELGSLFFRNGWLTRRSDDRALTVTSSGRLALEREFVIALD